MIFSRWQFSIIDPRIFENFDWLEKCTSTRKMQFLNGENMNFLDFLLLSKNRFHEIYEALIAKLVRFQSLYKSPRHKEVNQRHIYHTFDNSIIVGVPFKKVTFISISWITLYSNTFTNRFYTILYPWKIQGEGGELLSITKWIKGRENTRKTVRFSYFEQSRFLLSL